LHDEIRYLKLECQTLVYHGTKEEMNSDKTTQRGKHGNGTGEQFCFTLTFSLVVF